tara:strand:- start:287 stop:613 length:327 start_codon:yes stop_codon:yes gene_type:complete
MSDYGASKKQICFDSLAKTHADLKIRLHADDLKIRDFFNEVVMAYVGRDENIIKFVDKLKEKKRISKALRNKTSQSRRVQKKVVDQFGLSPDEIENIFDIIEKENSDL